jgi:thiosulfate sulfurtransferase
LRLATLVRTGTVSASLLLTKPSSISPQDLYGAIGTAGAPVLIDVRRSAAFAADNRMIVGAIRRNPDEIQSWRPELTSGPAVVVYCVHGRQVSQETASALRGAGWRHAISSMGLRDGPSTVVTQERGSMSLLPRIGSHRARSSICARTPGWKSFQY